jgi:hypothetical protein
MRWSACGLVALLSAGCVEALPLPGAGPAEVGTADLAPVPDLRVPRDVYVACWQPAGADLIQVYLNQATHDVCAWIVFQLDQEDRSLGLRLPDRASVDRGGLLQGGARCGWGPSMTRFGARASLRRGEGAASWHFDNGVVIDLDATLWFDRTDPALPESLRFSLQAARGGGCHVDLHTDP